MQPQALLLLQKRGMIKMMKLALDSEMRKIDELLKSKYGIPGIVLMENAGKVIVEEIIKKSSAEILFL